MQIDWKQGGILYSIFINNPRVSERQRQPLPQRYLGILMEPNKRTGGFPRASSFSQQSNCKSSTLSSKLSRGTLLSPVCSLLSTCHLLFPSPCSIPGIMLLLSYGNFHLTTVKSGDFASTGNQ